MPPFVHGRNHHRIPELLREVEGPWLLKPRSEASSVGIRKLHHEGEVWPLIEELGDAQSHHLIEKMVPGDVFHVDAIVEDRKVVFAEAHQYRKPLLEVVQGGGIFSTRTVERGSALEQLLLAQNARVLEQLGLLRGVAHTEFIRDRDDGTIHFLETSARVGGVHISDLVEATTSVNLWHEWAKIEISQGDSVYVPPPKRLDYGGLIVSLARQEVPDTAGFCDPEIVWRLTGNPNHVGFIVRSDRRRRIEALLDDYESRIAADFTASMPAPSSPTA
ncbi:MAG: hypothetical protein NVSMB1_13290 [Polyangiales bacterium]